MVTKVAEANQIDVVFDSYIENSIKESAKANRFNDVEPIEYVNLLLKSLSPVELERFCVSSKNRTEELNFILVLSGYVTNGGGMQDCVMFKLG